MYTIEEFDKQKTKVMGYLLYKKRTQQEVKNKFATTIQQDLLCDIIEYVKQAGYLDEKEYIERSIQEYMALKTMSIREIQYKLYSKGVAKDALEDYFYEHKEELQDFELNCAKKIAIKKADLEPEELKKYLMQKAYQQEIIKEVLECKTY